MANNEINNHNLRDAKANKKDEFYTTYEDIEAEMNYYYEYNHDVFKDKIILCPCDDPEWSEFTRYFVANFKFLGLKKLICTSYVKSSGNNEISLFEKESPNFNIEKHKTNGKIFILDNKTSNSTLEYEYLEGDGDFRSEEVTKLRDEADIIITNPPFSLFREFMKWIFEANKQFSIIGNVNAITYKEIFPLIKDNKLWLGNSIQSGDRKFTVPDDYSLNASICGIDKETGKRFIRVKGVRWFTNLDFKNRHDPKKLSTIKDNLRYNKKLIKKLNSLYSKIEYPHYDNYDAIEVPYSDAIPNDYNGVMGVPITFLDKYNPDEFEIIGGFNGYKECDYENSLLCGSVTEYIDKNGKTKKWRGPTINKKTLYYRILIKRKG